MLIFIVLAYFFWSPAPTSGELFRLHEEFRASFEEETKIVKEFVPQYNRCLSLMEKNVFDAVSCSKVNELGERWEKTQNKREKALQRIRRAFLRR